ncbi:MAG: hypothetical protein IJZ23_01700 [Roseburia sp.]|nr:hypothetical protein [Roseburia sp.]
MFSTLFEKHKKPCLIAGGALCVLLLITYLCMLFQPGYWYMDAFLSKQKDGSFAGSDSYGKYQIQITRTNAGASITVSVDDLIKEYRITGTSTGEDVCVYEGDALVFRGHTTPFGDSDYMLIGEDGYDAGSIRIFTNNIEPEPEELFPSYSWLYSRAASEATDTRGEPAMLFLIGIFLLALVLDIKFPDRFFTLRCRHYVTGGEPSDWYRDVQQIGRVVLVIAILACIGRSLYPF